MFCQIPLSLEVLSSCSHLSSPGIIFIKIPAGIFLHLKAPLDLTVLSEKHINWKIRAFISQTELYLLFTLIVQHCSNFAFIHFLQAFPFPNSNGKNPCWLLPLYSSCLSFVDAFSPTTSAFPTLRCHHPFPLLLQQRITLTNLILQSWASFFFPSKHITSPFSQTSWSHL